MGQATKKRHLLALASITLALVLHTATQSAYAETTAAHVPSRAIKHVTAHLTRSRQKAEETVLAIGGSAARGWKDPHDDSYLKRAFQSLSESGSTNYTYDDQTIIGGRPTELNLELFTSWLDQDHPQVVVISWGLLNDIAANTPVAALRQAVHDEILESLVSHAVVLVVTPPVVKATATGDHTLFDNYVAAEHQVETTMDNKNVHWLDLNADMTAYMQAHGETWEQYYGDDWHPNEAGHVLGGQLLYDELNKTFGSGPITFEESK